MCWKACCGSPNISQQRERDWVSKEVVGAPRNALVDSLQTGTRDMDAAMFQKVGLSPLPPHSPSLVLSLPMPLSTGVTFCPASKLIPKAADMPSTAAGETPAVMHAALQPSFTTKALA